MCAFFNSSAFPEGPAAMRNTKTKPPSRAIELLLVNFRSNFFMVVTSQREAGKGVAAGAGLDVGAAGAAVA